jgi:hypothetical protein
VSTAADKIKADAEQKPTAPAADTAEVSDAHPATPVAAVRQKNVRRTVDLSPAAHRGLDNWQRTTADRLGLARVTGQEVLAALVDRLLSDPQLSEQITHAVGTQRL